MSDRLPLLGIDIGNVIMAGDNDALFGPSGFGSYSEEKMLAIPEVSGAVDTIAHLTELFGAEQVYLISKAHKNTEAKTLRWLAHRDFCTRTEVLQQHVWFCRERPEKAVICHWLDIAYFVDDRPDVLFAMKGIVPYRYLFGPQWKAAPAGIIATCNWTEAEYAIRQNYPIDRSGS
jgi:hypothetical protein